MDLNIDVNIKDMGSDGEGIGTLPSGKTVFVQGALPGEVCRIEIINEKAKFCEGNLREILTPSPDRTGKYEDDPPGAGLAHLSYEAQLKYKEQKVRSCLQRLGRQDEELLRDIVKPTFPSEDTWHYRNHMQYKISGNKICLTASSSDELIPAGDSPLEYIVFNNIRETLEETFNHAPTTLFCGLVLRGSERTKQVLIEFVSDSPAPHETVLRNVTQYIKATELERHLKENCPYEIKGILLRISNTSVSKRVRSGKRFTITGEDCYEEKLCGCNFRIKAGAFFQVNIPQAEHLYRFAAEDLKSAKVIWDVYCGTGSIGISVTDKEQTLIGIESVQEAVNSARINASLSGRDDAKFICRPAERMDLNKGDLPRPDAVIVDPPRKGMDPMFVKNLLKVSPEKISYVSCDPATMARDIRTLTEGGYKLISVRPVDMFPNTPHVETCCLLEQQKRAKDFIEIEYRKADIGDAERLVEIYNASFYSDYIKYGECPAYGRTKEIMEQSIIDYPKFLIIYNGNVAGCISCRKLTKGTYEVGCLCVIPEFQGRGIGTAAMNFAKSHYSDWKKFTLITPIDKTENVRFYTEKCGFSIHSEEMDGKVRVVRFVLER